MFFIASPRVQSCGRFCKVLNVASVLPQLVFDLCTKVCAVAASAIRKLIGVENACPFSVGVFNCVRSQCFVDQCMGNLYTAIWYLCVKIAIPFVCELIADATDVRILTAPKVNNALRARHMWPRFSTISAPCKCLQLWGEYFKRAIQTKCKFGSYKRLPPQNNSGTSNNLYNERATA